MRYVPNLIPEKNKILKEYFKESTISLAKKNTASQFIGWILGIIFFLTALAFIKHPLVLLVLGLVGFILIPPGYKLLENKLRFQLTSKIKAVVCSVLFLSTIPLINHYAEIDKQEAYEQKRNDEQEQKEKAIAEKNEKQRKDSLTYYVERSNQFKKGHKIEYATKELQYALTFASTQVEKDQIEKEKISITTIKSFDLIKAGKYQTALSEINNLLTSDPGNTDLLYNRAICYSKTGQIQGAVNDLKPLLQAGSPDVKKLYEKINPVRRKIIGYETLCCDGTSSNATGRGACSHHGGVCDWNHPIYQEYRKYE